MQTGGISSFEASKTVMRFSKGENREEGSNENNGDEGRRHFKWS